MYAMRRALAIVAAVVVLCSAALVAPAPARGATDQPHWAVTMLKLVNAQRAKVGVHPLVLCARLTAASQKYARVMARTGHFDHSGPDGRQPWERGAAEGYGYRTYGENIAAGQDSVRDVMRAWVNSPGHYANLVNGSFTHLGVGRAASSQSRLSPYWVQNFGAGGKCGS